MKRVAQYGLFLLLIFITSLACLNRRSATVSFNQEIQFDDFAFSVLDVRNSERLDQVDPPLEPRGSFCIVTLQVANHAKRVPFVFDNKYPVLVDDSGREYHVSAVAQAALQSAGASGDACSGPLPAGSTCVREMVFDLPVDCRPSYLRICWGGALTDLLDLAFIGDKRISLTGQVAADEAAAKK